MLKRKSIIPMAAIMLVSSSIGAFANDVEITKNKEDEYKVIIYKSAKVSPSKGLNIRSTPVIEEGNKLYAVSKGSELDVVGQANDWYKVELENEKFGWINSKYVELNNKSLYVNVERVNFREGASLDSKVNKVLEKNTKIEFIEDNDEWIKVKYEGKEGYIYNKYVTDEVPEINTNKSIVKQNTNLKESTITQNNKTSITKSPALNNKPSSNKKPSVNNNKPSTDHKQPVSSSNPQESQRPTVDNTNKQSAIVNLAYAQLGKPYVWGAEGPNSFDCSGLMNYIFKNGAGINLPRTSKQQSNVGTTVSKANLQPGDLIFSTTDGSGGVSHVGVYVGNGEMIHAPKPGDVVQKSKINNSYWNNTYLWAKRVI